jgi:putative sterol carrier protein
MNVEQAFEVVRAAFVSGRASTHCAVIQLDLKASDGSVKSWQVCVDNGTYTCECGAQKKPRITAAMNEEDFIALVESRVTPQEVFLKKRVKLTGNVMFGLTAVDWFKPTEAALALLNKR